METIPGGEQMDGRAEDRDAEERPGNGWLLTLDVRSQPTRCAYIGAGEGMLLSPRPRAVGCARPAFPVVVRLVAGHLHRAAVVAHSDGAAGLLNGPDVTAWPSLSHQRRVPSAA